MRCDDIFQEIQRLEERKERIKRARSVLSEVDETPSNPYDEWVNDADNREAAAERALGKRQKPLGADGQPTNFGQIIDSLGEDGALPVAADLIGLNKGWQKYDPASADAYMKVNGANVVADRINAIYAEVGEEVSKSKLLGEIQKNSAPFVHILENMSRLQVYDDITRVHMADKVGELADIAESTGLPPNRRKVAEFIQAYEVAMYAHGMRNLGSRRAGQLLQQLKGRSFDDTSVKIILDEDAVGEAAAVEALATEVSTKPGPDGERVPKEQADYIRDDEVTKSVIEAAIEGKKGAKELRDIQKTLLLDGVDPKNGAGDGQWDRTWKAAARAAYKDSILGSAQSIGRNNYLAQKLVYMVEGLRAMSTNGYRLMEGSGMRQLNLLDPTESGFIRNALKAKLDGARFAFTAEHLANQLINDGLQEMSWPKRRMASMRRAIDEGFFDGHTPFATRTDDFDTQKGTLSPEDQYKVAIEVFEAPFEGNPMARVMQFRNKMAWSIKTLSNKYFVNPQLDKMGIKPLPVTSVLQMNAAIDQRQGMRVFLVHRANELMLETAKKYPDKTYKQWTEIVEAQVDDLLIKSTPTQGQVARYRKQFNLGDEVTDEMISSKLAQQNVGFPLLDTPGAKESLQASVAQRMQNKPTGPAGEVDSIVQKARKHESIDATIASFWRSPFNQYLWDWVLGLEAAKVAPRAIKLAGTGLNPNAKITPKQLAEFESSAIMAVGLYGAFKALDDNDQIIGGGPVDPARRRVWREALRARGQKPNSILGIPMGGLPIANTLFLMKDLADVVNNQKMNGFDASEAALDSISLLAAQIMRMPGFYQAKTLMDAFSDRNPNVALKTASMWLNSWFNPINGGLRDAERLGGINRESLVTPKLHQLSRDSGFLFETLGPDHPMNTTYAYLQQMAYESSPGLAHWGLGVPVQKKNYLGDDLRTPAGSAAWEWPLGMVGIRQGEQDHTVTNTLEYMGLLQPPSVQMTGLLEGVPVPTELIQEHNDIVGSIESTGFGTDAASFGGFSYTVKAEAGGQIFDQSVQAGALLYRLTRGKTQKQALNAFFNDPLFAKLETNPVTTSDPAVQRMSSKDRASRPAQRIVARIQKYYADLATEQLRSSSTSPEAEQWRKDVAAVEEGKALDIQSFVDLQGAMQ